MVSEEKDTTIDVEQILRYTDEIDEFQTLMMEYECAVFEVRTKLDVLNRELSLENERNPFEYIKSRVKSAESIYEKMHRREIPFTVKNMESQLHDIAGVRVICSFIDDIYMLRDCMLAQDDVVLVEEKDYIAHPKPNGYRSLHVIIEVPIFMTSGKKMRRVELQFRTIAMDFWASLEHKLKYKKNVTDADSIAEELFYSAEMVNQLDRRMQQIRERIEENTLHKIVQDVWK